jgi:DNA repair photolyase
MNPPRGRGANHNPANRFEPLHVEVDDDAWIDQEPARLKTQYLRDDSSSALTKNNAEDLSFAYGLNPYRGCEHGCAYCYARTYHEYLGYSSGLDFESVIIVKPDIAALLEKELSNPRYRPGVVNLSGVTDCYQPIERKLALTGSCIEVLARFRNPVVVITKNQLITRDITSLSELARHQAVAVYLSITTLDPNLARDLEPRASSPRARLETIATLAANGIPMGVSAAPLIPGLNDSELPAILEAAAHAGASFSAYSVVRLPGTVANVFSSWLGQHRPMAKDKILDRIRNTHQGALNSTTPKARIRGTGELAGQIHSLHKILCKKLGLSTGTPALNHSAFRRPQTGQGELF